MSQNQFPVDTSLENEQILSCDICLTCVPLSEAGTIECEEYIAYFFGLECYAQWIDQQKQDALQSEK